MAIEFVELIVAAVVAPFVVAGGVLAEVVLLSAARSAGIEPGQLLLAEAVGIPLVVALFSSRGRRTAAGDGEVTPLRGLSSSRKAA